MRKLRIFTALSCAFLMFVLSGCQSSEAFRPSADDTWGDLCRKFEPEWFDALPKEIQAEYDSVILGEEPIKKNRETVSASTPVISEKEPRNLDAKYYSDSEILSNPNQPDKEYSMVDLGVEISKQEKAVDYGVSVMLIGHGAPKPTPPLRFTTRKRRNILMFASDRLWTKKGGCVRTALPA